MNRPTLLCLAGLLIAPGFVCAQDGADAPADQIIVTASRTPLELRRLGNPVTVISRAEIERRQVRSVAELLRSVPGFAVSQSGVTGSQTQVRVRGAEANHVLVLIDGVRANDPATGDEFRWEFLSTGNIERVEIVRGPQSTQWGSEAVAAVVHVITRDGRAGDTGRIGGYAEGGSNASINAGLDAGIGGERWSLSASLERLDTDGDNISRTGNERDGATLETAAVGARFDFGDAIDVHATVRTSDAFSEYDPVDFFTTGLPADGDVATDAHTLSARVGIDARSGASRFGHSVGMTFFESDNRNRLAGIEDSSSAAERIGVFYQLDIAVGDDRAILAIEHEQSDYRQRGAIVFGDPNQDQRIDNSSLVAEYQGLTGRLSWIAGARFDRNSDFEDALNARLAVSFALTEATLLRASVGSGRKNPTFTEMFGFFPAGHSGNPDLQPERSISWEAGLRHEFGNAAILDVALFRQDLEDEINGFVFDPVTFLSRAENMPGDSRRSGAELELQLPLGDRASLRGRYSYVEATAPDVAGASVREIRRPRHSGGLGLDISALDERLTAALTADYGGRREDTFFPPFPAAPTNVVLDDYWLIDLAVQFRLTDGLHAFARGANLLDERYEEIVGYRRLGRTAFVGLRADFR